MAETTTPPQDGQVHTPEAEEPPQDVAEDGRITDKTFWADVDEWRKQGGAMLSEDAEKLAVRKMMHK